MIANRSAIDPGDDLAALGRRLRDHGELCKDDVLLRGPETRSACTITARIPADARADRGAFQVRDRRGALRASIPMFRAGLPFRPTPFTATFRAQHRRRRRLPRRSPCSSDPRATSSAARSAPRSTSCRSLPRPCRLRSRSFRWRDTRDRPRHRKGGSRHRDQSRRRRRRRPTCSSSCRTAGRATPASAPVSFTREDESMTVRFRLLVPPARC